MRYELLGDNILVEPIKEEFETTSFGLVIPMEKESLTKKGIVVAVGPGTESEEMYLKVGDEVVYRHNFGAPFRHKDQEYILIRQAATEGIIEKI
jgi:co-chaperonin GroES (HSP10)